MLSLWEKQSFYAHADVLIVGAGLMGLWSALELKKRNSALRITLIERNTTPLGASTRNAGFACFGSPTELLHDAETMGTDRMLELVDMRYRGIRKIRAYFDDNTTGFDPCGGYECLNNIQHDPALFDDQLVWLNEVVGKAVGTDKVFKDTSGKLSALGLQGFDRLIENTMEASLHSGKLVQALTQRVQAEGVNILYDMELTEWEEDRNGVRVNTSRHITLSADKLLFCTNAFTPSLVQGIGVTPARGQVIVTTPVEGLPLKGTFHYDEGFYYWRNLGNRILLGGARNTAFAAEETTDLAGSLQIRDTLEKFLRDHLHPSYPFQVEHHWSGVMGFTQNKTPLVECISPHTFAAIACNGMGVALTPLIAERVAAVLQ